jgi:nicotinamide riboside kinase
VTVVVTGLASSGKARLVDALRERLAAPHIAVRTAQSSSSGDAPSLHVHAETDVEALIEGGLKTVSRHEAQRADLVVPVDWESTDRSVDRVVAALHDRGVADVEAGV